MRNVVAMVLAGGRVSEFDVLTVDRPKSAVPFGGLYRVIDFPLSNLMYSGIEHIGILSQYRPFSLMNHIGSGESWDLYGRNRSIHVLPPFKGHNPTDWYRGTADAVYQNLDYIHRMNAKKVLIVSGDHIYKMDYAPLFEFHKKMNADLTGAFKEVPEEQSSRFGLGKIADDTDCGGRLLDYAEKPANPISNMASITVYLFDFEVLEDILERMVGELGKSDFGRHIIPHMLSEYHVCGYKFPGYWGYTRTISEYYKTSMSLLGDQPAIDPDEWKIRTNLAHRNIQDRAPAFIAPTAQVNNSLIYNGCRVFGTVQNSILFPGVCVKEGAIVQNSIVMFDCRIGEKAKVRNAIIDTDAVIERAAMLGQSGNNGLHFCGEITQGDLVLIGKRTVVPEYAILPPGECIHPHLNGKKAQTKMYLEGEIAA
ncbi:MAG: glucose-1-phosphate adenylyltransferase family protein [bacterium]